MFAEGPDPRGREGQRIVAITAAMPSGTGLDKFEQRFPDRTFDVGIAEQHAVTFAAGLAVEGYKPFCAIYSTFLQRAYDQVVHDVALQRLPVRFAIDRAGLVGAGRRHPCRQLRRRLPRLPAQFRHHGSLRRGRARPHGGDCRSTSTTGRRPSAIRAAKASASTCREQGVPIEIGKGRIIVEGSKIALLCLGTRLQACLKAAEELQASTACRPPSPMPALPSRSTPSWCADSPASTRS